MTPAFIVAEKDYLLSFSLEKPPGNIEPKSLESELN